MALKEWWDSLNVAEWVCASMLMWTWGRVMRVTGTAQYWMVGQSMTAREWGAISRRLCEDMTRSGASSTAVKGVREVYQLYTVMANVIADKMTATTPNMHEAL